VAITALALVAPVLILIGLLIKLTDGGPALFGHQRFGYGGRTFKCLKFRSMVLDADARLAQHLAANPDARREWSQCHKLRNDPRVTLIGQLLRRSSLDELPQLFNVLRGDMSIVGPRPIVQAEIAKYGVRYAWYCKVRPGITGYWQVNGRSHTSYRRRIAMDTIYAKNKCIWWDIKIVCLTIPAVVSAQGAC
jgi:lipopolysaccharide/colanic/teichoic acid biosynthesis glycosyltransferase